MKIIISVLTIALTFNSLAFSEETVETQPTTASAEQTSDKPTISTGKYITGGIIGSTVGFGIGHAIQGRYKEKGWIFTATEAAGLLLMAGSTTCSVSSGTCTTNSNFGLGFGIALGFHVWEIVDIWTATRPSEEKVQTYIIPKNDGTQVGMLFHF